MKPKWQTISLVFSVVLVVAMCVGNSVRVQASVSSVQFNTPSAGTYGEDGDYFTNVWGNPRDMDQDVDLYSLRSTCGPVATRMFSPESISGGMWSGTKISSGANADVYMLNPGWGSSLDTLEDGQVRPITASLYNQLTFRMYASGSTNAGVWYTDGQIASVKGLLPFTIYSGWNIYTIDLTKGSGWGGSITGLWFNFSTVANGTTLKLDWIRLTPQQSRQIGWTGSGTGNVAVYLGSDSTFSQPEQYSRLRIFSGSSSAQETQASAGSLTIPASFAPGTYYARVADSASGDNTSNAWVFEPAPVAEILAPGYSSGPDWATTVTGNPWDMSGTDDIDAAETQSLNYAASGGVLDVTNIADGQTNPCGTPWPHRPLALNTHGQWIDTGKFKYLTFRYKVDQAPDQGAGGVIRARWLNTSIWAAGRTDDISLYNNGWNTYQLNLATVPLEAETAGWTEWNYNWLHLMANESHFAWTSHLDWVKLTADNEATGSYTVGWNLIQGDPTQTTIYWDADQNPAAGLIGGYVVPTQTQPVDPPPYANNVYLPITVNSYNPDAVPVDAEHSYSVSTDGLTDGQWYYIALKLEDGYNTRWWYSELPVKILQ